MLSLKVYVFTDQGDINKNRGPGDPTSQSASVQFPESSAPRTASMLQAEMVKPHRLHQPERQISLILSHCTETG